MSDPVGSEPTRDPLPEVGHPRLAEALERVGDLDALPLAEHHDRLVEVHEVLHGVLHPDPTAG